MALIVTDALKFRESENDQFRRLSLSANFDTPVPVSQGGTGANNAADARENLGAVSKTGDTINGSYRYIFKMRDTSHYVDPICFENETPSSYTYKPHIGFHNTGGNSSHPGVINLIPFGTNASPWGRADGLSISRDDVKFNGSDVRVGTVAVANGGTGATTAADAITNLGIENVTDLPITATAGSGVTIRDFGFHQRGRIVFGYIYFDITSALYINAPIATLSGSLPNPYDPFAVAPLCNLSGPAGMAYISRVQSNLIKTWGETPVGTYNYAQFVYVAR